MFDEFLSSCVNRLSLPQAMVKNKKVSDAVEFNSFSNINSTIKIISLCNFLFSCLQIHDV